MANMLRKSASSWGDFGCCDHCARNKKVLALKPGPRERHVARQREKRSWRKQVARDDV